MTESEYSEFINAMPEEWQLNEDSEEQVQADIDDYKKLQQYNKEKLDALKKVFITTEE